jgi:hypothetical protein
MVIARDWNVNKKTETAFRKGVPPGSDLSGRPATRYTIRGTSTPMEKTKRRTSRKPARPATEATYESRSLAKGLTILEALAAAATPLPLKDLAEIAG